LTPYCRLFDAYLTFYALHCLFKPHERYRSHNKDKAPVVRAPVDIILELESVFRGFAVGLLFNRFAVGLLFSRFAVSLPCSRFAF